MTQVIVGTITLTNTSESPSFIMGQHAGGHFQVDSGDVTVIAWYARPVATGTFKPMIDPTTDAAVEQTVSTTGDFAIPYTGNGRIELQPRIGTGTTGVITYAIKE